MIEDITKLLEAPRTRQALSQCWESIVAAAHDQCFDETALYGVASPDEAIEIGFALAGYPSSPVRVIRECVLERVSGPPVITAEELVDALFSLLPRRGGAWMDAEAFEEAFPFFVNRVESLASMKRSPPFAVAQLPVRTGSAVPEARDCFELWCGDAVSISTCGTARLDVDFEFAPRSVSADPRALYAQVHGRATPTAMTLLAREFRDLIRSLIRSFQCVSDVDRDEAAKPLVPTGLPVASVAHVEREIPSIRTCLDAYFAVPGSKRDSLDRRVKNAITLLVESDAQRNHALGIGLAVTAIEALLGGGKSEIATTIAGRAAVLLEPELSQRGNSKDFVKKVYGDRCDVLHGSKLDAEATRRGVIRRLASAVLYAVCQCRRGLAADTPDALMDELTNREYLPGPVPGVTDFPRVRSLWSS